MGALKFLFLDILTDDPKIKAEDNQILAEYGGYSGLMHSCLGLENELEVIEAGFYPLADLDVVVDDMSPDRWDGVVIGGSVKDIGPNHFIEHWQAQVFRFIDQAHEWNIPMLGICGGHQYGARALSRNPDAVIQNSMGPNRGSSSIILTNDGERHPLFKDCSNSSLFQWSHAFVVMRLPVGAVRLAVHSQCLNAAFQAGSFIGVQWHPEFGALEASDYGVKLMREILTSHLNEAEVDEERHQLELALDSDLRPAPDSAKIFANWVEMVRTGFFQKDE